MVFYTVRVASDNDSNTFFFLYMDKMGVSSPFPPTGGGAVAWDLKFLRDHV